MMRLFDRFPLRYAVPNAVTCTSVVFGLASIRLSFIATEAAQFQRAAWFILYAVLLDKVDGAVARKLRASSEFGVQLDSFSDFVTFGIAPAALITSLIPWAMPQPWSQGSQQTLLLCLGALYAVAAALRLAKFNITTATNDPRFFRGLPSTSSGGLLASAFLAHQELGLDRSLLSAMAVFMTLNAVLMVSNLPQPKLALSRNKLALAFQVFIIASVYILIPLHRFPTYLVTVAATYTLLGFVYGVIETNRGGSGSAGGDHEDDEDEDEELAHQTVR